MAEAFNAMALGLKEREESLRVSNEKLAASNKSYIDLIGFVAHELKGILASAVMNAYAVRDGYLGLVNFKQRKAMDSVTRNLDYLDATVKKFLNLGRIERGELAVNKTSLNLKKDVFDVSINSLAPMAVKKGLQDRQRDQSRPGRAGRLGPDADRRQQPRQQRDQVQPRRRHRSRSPPGRSTARSRSMSITIRRP